jgi:hypothetical protein
MNTQVAWIVAAGIALGGLLNGGVYRVVATDASAYIVNSITGSVSFCQRGQCMLSR